MRQQTIGYAMAITGFIDEFDTKRGKARTIQVQGYPPLKLNCWYNEKTSMTKFPIKKVAWIQQSTKPEKVIIMEEIDFGNRRELRLRYHIIGKKPGMRGKWTFGQYATLIPLPDFLTLLEVAGRNGLLGQVRPKSLESFFS
ncbi:MAG TPA: hypothetical protein VGS11_07640 [Candidatus Bathyarchaeia archaeon]|nr:hypothetical protein [Candidatus Bathyarchaeia archaeon]